MKRRTTFLLSLLTLITILTGAPVHAETDQRLYEMRTYIAAPGKLDALLARFRDHTVALFAKHGMTNVGYWIPAENPERKLIYLLSFPDKAARDQSFKSFGADPAWQAAQKASEADGKLVDGITSVLLTPADFSKIEQPSAASESRVYELRTYTCAPDRLPNLLGRFREHTIELFSKHGMKHFGYFTPAAGQAGAENTLIYFLIHESKEAMNASFTAFRSDPVWIAAKEASEKAAGGSLTVPDGVKSTVLKPTDFSPVR